MIRPFFIAVMALPLCAQFQMMAKQAFLALLVSACALAQSSAGSISGVVIDASGATVPGAKVTAANQQAGIRRSATSGTEGGFTLPQLPPGIYSVSVEKEGFDRIEKTGVVLATGGRVNAGDFTLSAKGLTQSITVQAEGAQLQVKTESGERSDLITGVQVRDLALNGRNLLDLLKVVPGVVSTVNGQVADSGGLGSVHVNGARGAQNELTIDGSSNVITGTSTNQHISINPDAIAEVKILTSNFQAEHAKASGGFIQYTTRSGTDRFHGGARYFRRHDSMNANDFFSNSQGLPRGLYRYNYYGYDLGGPVVIPGTSFNRNRDKLFFFWNQEFYRQLTPIGAKSIRVPTALERGGDFSQTTDGNGARVFISDPLARDAAGNRLPCTAANTPATPGGCFISAGRLHVIPRERFFRDGQAFLNLFPAPNDPAGGARYNYTSQISSTFPRREDTLRLDYNFSPNLRLFGRYTYNPDTQSNPYGINQTTNFPLVEVARERKPVNTAFSLTHIFSPTTTNEFIFGPSWYYYIFAPIDEGGTRRAHNIAYRNLFPDADPSDFLPQLSFAGIANQTFPTISMTGQVKKQSSETLNFSDNFGKLFGKHTTKFGIYVQRSSFRPANGVAVNGQVAFSNDANNPANLGHPFASALVGGYTTYGQGNNRPYPDLRYTNTEWYAQDTWKLTRRLTLDYGLRFYLIGPESDVENPSGSFNSARFNPARAVRLYAPVLVQNQRRAIDAAARPATLTLDNTLAAVFIGRIVPNSGDLLNGIGQSRDGYPAGGFEHPGLLYAPRVGFAWDVNGNSRTVIRGGFGVTYQRVATTISIALANQPPNVVQPTLFYGNLADLATASSTLAPTGLAGSPDKMSMPSIYSFSLGVQRNVGFGALLDVAYVGALGRHQWQNRDLNSVPYLATFTRAGQDPSRFAGGVVPDVEPGLPAAYRQAGYNFTGANALPIELLRPYTGYGGITYREFVGSTNYHSLQVALNRRFSKGLTFGLAYTWSKVFTTSDEDNETSHPFDTRRQDYRLAAWDRNHTFVANYVYELPKMARLVGGSAPVRAVLDNWQLSGIMQYYGGTPRELDLGIAGINTGQRITGSYSVAPRLYLRSDPGRSVGDDGPLVDPNAFAVPAIGDLGPYPRTYLRNPGWFNNDLSLFKNLPLGGERRYLQLRLEMFNVFNHTQFTGINTATQLTTSTGVTGANIFAQYPNLAVTNNLRTPQSTQRLGQHFGEYNSARGGRVIQLGVKMYF